MRDTARKALVAALVVVGVVVLTLALWKLRLVIALLFLAFIIAAAMRPSVEWLQRRRVPGGHEDPRERVERDADPARHRRRDEHDPDDERVDAEAPPEPRAHARNPAVAGVAA